MQALDRGGVLRTLPERFRIEGRRVELQFADGRRLARRADRDLCREVGRGLRADRLDAGGDAVAAPASRSSAGGVGPLEAARQVAEVARRTAGAEQRCGRGRAIAVGDPLDHQSGAQLDVVGVAPGSHRPRQGSRRSARRPPASSSAVTVSSASDVGDRRRRRPSASRRGSSIHRPAAAETSRRRQRGICAAVVRRRRRRSRRCTPVSSPTTSSERRSGAASHRRVPT